MRLVLDTDVMVAAVQSPTGASRRLLLAGVDGQFEIAVSVPLMLEWEAVLKRPNVLHTARASEGDIDIILERI